MKKGLILIAATVVAVMNIGCGSTAQPVANTAPANSQTLPTRDAQQPPVVSSHSAEKSANSKPAQPSSPNQMAIDVSEMTSKIEKADKDLKAKPADAAAKKTLAAAYFERAFALTKAAQYRSALGDFRKGLKLDPSNEEAKSMHDQIISIFESIGREPPKEGEEPPPMPFNK